MTTILVTGVESSGTRLVARIVEHMGVNVVHRSVPNGRVWWDDPGPVGAAIVVIRDMAPMMRSQTRDGHMDAWPMVPVDKARVALLELVSHVHRLGVPWWWITYEELVARPSVVAGRLAGYLGVEPVEPPDDIYDGNA